MTSVGIEYVDDLIGDLEQALKALGAVLESPCVGREWCGKFAGKESNGDAGLSEAPRRRDLCWSDL